MSVTEVKIENGKQILVTGATGYIGGRLVPRMLKEGYRIRCLVRKPTALQAKPWRDGVEVTQGDVLEPNTLGPALKSVDSAYYLIHSMGGGEGFHDRDLMAAHNFASAAKQAGVKNIIYLGGLGDPEADLSRHLRSRQETGEALRNSGAPVTEFRAAVVVGSGSLSFEMVRHLTERLPVMICPRWVFTRIQPIGIGDLLAYLTAAIETPDSVGEIIEIGGADVLTYGDMMLVFAHVRGLKRFLLPVPVLTPRLSSYWVNLVTPIPASVARPLIDGLRNEVVVRDNKAQQLFPGIKPIDYENAVRLALNEIEN